MKKWSFLVSCLAHGQQKGRDSILFYHFGCFQCTWTPGQSAYTSKMMKNGLSPFGHLPCQCEATVFHSAVMGVILMQQGPIHHHLGRSRSITAKFGFFLLCACLLLGPCVLAPPYTVKRVTKRYL